MTRPILLIAILLSAAAAYAQPYTVTSGARQFTPLTGGTTLNLGDHDLSAAISPTNFSFNYFGTRFTSFMVGSNGYIIMGDSGRTISAVPDHGTAPGYVIAPFWTDLIPHAGSIAWHFDGTELTVTFDNITQRYTQPTFATFKVRANVVLDTRTGVIRFQYGQVSGVTVTMGAYSTFNNTVAISGDSTQSPQHIIVGEIPRHVDSRGQVTDYPENMEVVFTPTAPTPPSFTSTPVTMAEATIPYSYTLTATGLPSPTFSAGTLPAWLQLNGDVLEGTPAQSDIGGPISITLYADNSAGQDTQTFNLTVYAPTIPPTFTSTPVIAAEVNVPYSYTLTADGDPAPTFRSGPLPGWLQLNGDVLEGTPGAADVGGPVHITLFAENVAGRDTQRFDLTVYPAPSAPDFTSRPITDATVGDLYTYTLTADGFPVPTFSASNLPGWLTLNGDTLEGTPGNLDVGQTGTLTLTATNSEGTDTQQFVIDVAPAPEAPVITSSPPPSAMEGSAYQYQIVATGHPAPTFSISGEPGWLSLAGDMLQGTPQQADIGVTGTITITAQNSEGQDTQSFTIDVSAMPEAPVITSTPDDSVTVGEIYSYSVTFTGNPPPTITFSGLPGWLVRSGSTLTGVPDSSHVGTTDDITVTATNSAGTDTQVFTITVIGLPAPGGDDGGGGCAAGAAGLALLPLLLPALLRFRRRRPFQPPQGQ
jgi:Synergist-CTERM protein sorting domain-containing protein